MNEGHEVLCRILAAQDVLLLPEPAERGDFTTIRWQHADRWRKSGLPFRGAQFTPGMSTKAAGALLGSLEAAGLITGARGATRRTTIKLTFAGHQLARDLIAWPCGAFGAFDVMAKIRRQTNKAGFCDAAPWWNIEPTLKNCGPEILWLLSAGWAVVDTESHGNRMMSFTDAGNAIKTRPNVKIEVDDDPDLMVIYQEALIDARCSTSAMEKLDPRDVRVLFLKTYQERTGAK
jgi:hypothetical protein